MADILEEKESVPSDVDLEKGVLSCDDEGYETPGKKDLLSTLKQPKEVCGNKKVSIYNSTLLNQVIVLCKYVHIYDCNVVNLLYLA